MLPSAELAYRSAAPENLRISPLDMDLEFQPEPLLHLITGSETFVRNVNDFKKEMKKYLDDDHFYYNTRRQKRLQNLFTATKPLRPFLTQDFEPPKLR